MRWNVWVSCGCAAAFLAVAAGAFGAHVLEERLSPRSLAVFETASKYLFYHGLALVLVGLLARGGTRGGPAGTAFLAGCLLFSGSLFGLALTGWTWLGAVTPLGGIAFLAGWALLAREALRQT